MPKIPGIPVLGDESFIEEDFRLGAIPLSVGSVNELGINTQIASSDLLSFIIGTEFQESSILRKVLKLIPERHLSDRKLYNEMISAINFDISSLYDKANVQLKLTDHLAISSINQILSRLSILKTKQKELELSNKAILDGFTDVFVDEFQDLSKVDLSKSIIDFQNGFISSVRQIGSEIISLDLSTISFEPIADIPVFSSLGLGSTFDILSSTISRASNIVEAGSPGPVTGRYILQLNKSYRINSINIELLKSKSETSLTIKLGKTISDALTFADKVPYNGNIINLSSTGVETKFVIIEINKTNFDSQQVDPFSGRYSYLYDFSVKEIQPTVDLFCHESFIESKDIKIPVDITEYTVASSNSSNECTQIYTEVQFGNQTEISHGSTGNFFSLLNNTFGAIGPRSIYRKDIVQLALQFPENTLNKTVTCFRNIKQKNVIINNLPSGWRSASNGFETNISVSEETSIDFGPNPILINGLEKQGIATFIPGVYNIITSRWLDIGDDYDPGLDRLYPYNHKYLLELNPFTKLAAEIIDFVGIFDLEFLSQFKSTKFGSISNNKIYVFIPDITTDEQQDWRKELFEITFKTANRRFDTFRVRFSLITRDNRVPVILDGYSVKMR